MAPGASQADPRGAKRTEHVAWFEATMPVRQFFRAVNAHLLSMSSQRRFQVRPATQRDAKAIAAIDLEEGATGRPLFDWREAIEFSEPQVQVVLDDTQVVGFVGFDRSRDTGTPPTTGEIWVIQVLRSHWGQGAGLALWDAAREGLIEEGCTQVTAWVPLRNERAIRFHELAGFKRDMSTAKTVVVGSVRREEVRLSRPLA